MAKGNKIMLGILTLLVITTGLYITFSDSARMRIDEDKSTFYVKSEYNRWIVSGREYNKLFDGTKLMNRDRKNTYTHHDIDKDNNVVMVKRYTRYIRGPTIIDTYKFDGNINDVTMFPIFHEIEIFNATGRIYQYEVRDLYYNGGTKRIDDLQEYSFGKKMKVKWDVGQYYAKIYDYKTSNKGKLMVKYRIKNDYVKINARLFDPPCTVLTDDFQPSSDTVLCNNESPYYINDTGLLGIIYPTGSNYIIDGNGSQIITNNTCVYFAAGGVDNVTIKNLNCSSINPTVGVGLFINGRTNHKLINNSISRFEKCIRSTGSGTLIENNTLAFCDDLGIEINQVNQIIRGNIINNISAGTGWGISLLSGFNNNTVENNIINHTKICIVPSGAKDNNITGGILDNCVTSGIETAGTATTGNKYFNIQISNVRNCVDINNENNTAYNITCNQYTHACFDSNQGKASGSKFYDSSCITTVSDGGSSLFMHETNNTQIYNNIVTTNGAGIQETGTSAPSTNNLFHNNTITSTGAYCIWTTGNTSIYRDNTLSQCGDLDVTIRNVGSDEKFVSFINNIKSDGLMNYDLNTGTAQYTNITINGTNDVKILLRSAGIYKTMYTGRKDINVLDNTYRTLSVPTLNTYCNSTVAACQYNFVPYTETISSGLSILVGHSIASEPKPENVTTTITDINWTYDTSGDLGMSYLGTGQVDIINFTSTVTLYLNNTFNNSLSDTAYNVRIPNTNYDFIQSGLNETLCPQLTEVSFTPNIAFYDPATGRLEQNGILPDNHNLCGYTYKINNNLGGDVRIKARLDSVDSSYKITINGVTLTDTYQSINEPILASGDIDQVTTMLDINATLSTATTIEYDIFFIGELV